MNYSVMLSRLVVKTIETGNVNGAKWVKPMTAINFALTSKTGRTMWETRVSKINISWTYQRKWLTCDVRARRHARLFTSHVHLRISKSQT